MSSQLSSICTVASASTHTEEIEKDIATYNARLQVVANGTSEAGFSSQPSSSLQRSVEEKRSSVEEKRRILQYALERIGHSTQSSSCQPLSIDEMRSIIALELQSKARENKASMSEKEKEEKRVANNEKARARYKARKQEQEVTSAVIASNNLMSRTQDVAVATAVGSNQVPPATVVGSIQELPVTSNAEQLAFMAAPSVRADQVR
jgi:uncharacterized membrane protein YgaE (UPF0421/DUF939 family)